MPMLESEYQYYIVIQLQSFPMKVMHFTQFILATSEIGERIKEGTVTSAEVAEVLVRKMQHDLVGLQKSKMKHANRIKTSHKVANNQLDEKRDDRDTDENEIPSSYPQNKRKEIKYRNLKAASRLCRK